MWLTTLTSDTVVPALPDMRAGVNEKKRRQWRRFFPMTSMCSAARWLQVT